MKEATLHLKSSFRTDLTRACEHLGQTKEAYKKLVRSLFFFYPLGHTNTRTLSTDGSVKHSRS